MAMACPFASLYPILKILRAASKMLLLSELEVSFVAAGLQSIEWDIYNPAIIRGGL